MVGWLYGALLLSAVIYVLVRGGAEERTVMVMLFTGSIATRMIYINFGMNFKYLKVPMLINESLVLAVLLAVAFRSKRFWPLPVASFQVAAFLALLTPYFGENIMSRGLGVAQGIWAYPQLIILALATWRGRRIGRAMPANSLPN